jgi:hypothetical protein
MNAKPADVIPLAKTQEEALRLPKFVGNPAGVKPAFAGAEGGELDKHLRQAKLDGCSAIVCPIGWNQDGSPQWGCGPLVALEAEGATSPRPAPPQARARASRKANLM